MRKQRIKGGFLNLFNNNDQEQMVDKWGNKIVDEPRLSVNNNNNSS